MLSNISHADGTRGTNIVDQCINDAVNLQPDSSSSAVTSPYYNNYTSTDSMKHNPRNAPFIATGEGFEDPPPEPDWMRSTNDAAVKFEEVAEASGGQVKDEKKSAGSLTSDDGLAPAIHTWNPGFPPPFPLLSPVTDVLARSPLQIYQSSHEGIDERFKDYVWQLIVKGSCTVGSLERTSTLNVLMAEVNPLDVKEAGVDFARAIAHRPSPAGYRTAFSLAYLQIIASVQRKKSQMNSPDASSSYTNGVPNSVDLVKTLRSFFSTREENSTPAPSLYSDGLEKEGTFVDRGRLYKTCVDHLPPSSSVTLRPFDPKRAVVYLCIPGDTDDTNPQFLCVAGWARWTALLTVMEGIKTRCTTQNVYHSYEQLLSTSVPIYILDGSAMTTADVLAVSAGLNLADSGSNPRQPVSAVEDGNAIVDEEGFLVKDILTKVRSRPFTLMDWIWTFHHLLSEVNHEGSSGTEKTIVNLLDENIENVIQYAFLKQFLDGESKACQSSPFVALLMDHHVKLGEKSSCCRSSLIAFLLSLLWPIPFEGIETLTFSALREITGSDDSNFAPFHPMTLRGKVRNNAFFWDNIFIFHVPYQVQCASSLADIFGLSRLFEIFFVPRTKKTNEKIQKLNWTFCGPASLIHYFAKNDSASTLVTRLVAHEPLRSMSHRGCPGSFETLSAFICMYNLHFLFELEGVLPGHIRYSDLMPGTESLDSNPAISKWSSSLPPLPGEVPDGDISRLFGSGCCNSLRLLRAILLLTSMTTDNPSQLLDLARTQLGESVSGSPLELPAACRPAFSPIAEMLLDNRDERPSAVMTRAHIEEAFEVVLGSLAELIFRLLISGIACSDSLNSPSYQKYAQACNAQDGLRARMMNQESIQTFGRNAPTSVSETILAVPLLEGLKGGTFIIQVFLRQCQLAQQNLALENSDVVPATTKFANSMEIDRQAPITAIFYVPSHEQAGNAPSPQISVDTSGPGSSGFFNMQINDVVMARHKSYEHILKSLNRTGSDPNTLPQYSFVWKFMESLENKDLGLSAALAELLMTYGLLKDGSAQVSPSEEEVGGRSLATGFRNMIDAKKGQPSQVFGNGSMQFGSPGRIQDNQNMGIPEMMSYVVKSATSASTAGKNVYERQQEFFSRLCVQKLLSLQHLVRQQQQNQVYPVVDKTANSRLTPSGALSTSTLKIPKVQTGKDIAYDIRHGGVTGGGVLDTQRRITHWFEERKAEARLLLTHVFRLVQDSNARGSQQKPSVVLRHDFRGLSPEEAKERAGPLSDLATDSTNLVTSLQEIPYQLKVEDASILNFSGVALDAIIQEIEPVLQFHLTDGLKQLMSIPEPGHFVVASARPAIICALWQTLVRLNPFLDVLHPLALNWQHTRALFCSWLWGQLRQRLERFWEVSHKGESVEDGPATPTLKWSMRSLPSNQDPELLSSLPDLTAARLFTLLKGPKILDRVCSAFYRFQCSGMANAKAALGATVTGMNASNLETIFSTAEPSLKGLFISLWTTVLPTTTVEDALHESEIAAAGFLKRYAPYVLSGLEQRDKQLDASGDEMTLDDNGTAEHMSKKRRRDLSSSQVGDDQEEDGMSRRGGMGRLGRGAGFRDDLPAAVSAGTNSVISLKRELKLLGRAMGGNVRLGSNRFGRYCVEDDDLLTGEGEGEEAGGLGVPEHNSSNSEWIKLLPLSLRARLEGEIPSSEIFDQVEHRLENLSGPRPLLSSPVSRPRQDVVLGENGKLDDGSLTMGEPSANDTDATRSNRSRRRRKRKSSLSLSADYNRDTDAEDPVLPVTSITADSLLSVRGSGSKVLNGAMPNLPHWLESIPAWKMWNSSALRGPLGRTMGDLKGFNLSTTLASEMSDVPMGIKCLSMRHTYKEAQTSRDISDPEWQLVVAVLDYLARHGIDGLYSAAAQKMFTLNSLKSKDSPSGFTGLNSTFELEAREFDDYCDHPQVQQSIKVGPQPLVKENTLKSLKYFLNGYFVPERTILSVNTATRRSPKTRIVRRRRGAFTSFSGGDEVGTIDGVPDVNILVDSLLM